MLPAAPRLSLEPVASFDESDKFVVGARAAFVDPSSSFQFAAEGAASQRYTNLAASASGSHDFEQTALWRVSYGAGYRFQEQPIEKDDLSQGFAFGWVSALTRPFPALGAPIRYAVQLEEGFQDSELAGVGFISDTRYTALKLLTGASGGTGPHDYSLNLGVQLGSTHGVSPDWSKLLLDSAYAVRVRPKTAFFDHRSIDLETRLTAGWLWPIGRGRAPQDERFFGGVRPHPFTEISDWNVRNAPFIRGYANNQFFGLLDGAPSGREHFAALNLTVALTTWRLPLLPREVYTNEEFLTKINAQKNSAREVLATYHESRDPAIVEVEKAADDVEPVLTSLQMQIESLTVPDDLSEALELCKASVDQALTNVKKGRTSKSFGVLRRDVAGGLPRVIRDCEENLNARLDRIEIHAAARQIEQERARIEDILENRVDHQAVERKVDEDFAIVDRALTAFVHEINLVSVDPVVLFDTAYVGPTASSVFVRYSVGGGLRVTLGSTASFTLGLRRQPQSRLW